MSAVTIVAQLSVKDFDLIFKALRNELEPEEKPDAKMLAARLVGEPAEPSIAVSLLEDKIDIANQAKLKTASPDC